MHLHRQTVDSVLLAFEKSGMWNLSTFYGNMLIGRRVQHSTMNPSAVLHHTFPETQGPVVLHIMVPEYNEESIVKHSPDILVFCAVGEGERSLKHNIIEKNLSTQGSLFLIVVFCLHIEPACSHYSVF